MEIYFLYLLGIVNFSLLCMLFFYFNQFSDGNRLIRKINMSVEDFRKDLNLFYDHLELHKKKMKKYKNHISKKEFRNQNALLKKILKLPNQKKSYQEIQKTEAHLKEKKDLSKAMAFQKSLELEFKDQESLSLIQNMLENNFYPEEIASSKDLALSLKKKKEKIKAVDISSMIRSKQSQNYNNHKILLQFEKLLQEEKSEIQISELMNLSLEEIHLFKIILSNKNL